MTLPAHDSGRIGRSAYWTLFAVNVVAVIVLLVGGIAAVASGAFVLGVLLLLAIAPVGIYFRVVMMRRCRDIGWPAALPWSFFGAGMLASFDTYGPILGAPESAQMPALGLSFLVSLADFAFMVVIGSIRGTSERADYDTIFGPDERDARMVAPVRPTRPAYRGETDERDEDSDARWDAAIQNALAARAGAGSAAPQPPAPSAGFGRKPVG